MKTVLLKLIKLLFSMCFTFCFWVGNLVILWPFIVLLHNGTAPAHMPVLLPNNFYFSPNYNREDSSNHITYKDGTEAIRSDVYKVMTYKDWIYGYRVGYALEDYYFICKYGEDCSSSQSYKLIEFNNLLNYYGLPEFSKWKGKSYYKLLQEQVYKGIDTGYGD